MFRTKLKMLLICVLSFFTIQMTNTLFSQIELNAKGGTFEHVTPWNDGYLGVIQTQIIAVQPKYRNFQYFDSSGKLIWDKRVDPYNYGGTTFCNGDSEYAYMIDKLFEKSYSFNKPQSPNFLAIYQIDKKGNVVEKTLPYTGEFEKYAKKSDVLSLCYVRATNKGELILVLTEDNKKYHLLKFDTSLNMKYSSIDFLYNKDLINNRKLSPIQFATNDQTLTLIQSSIEDDVFMTTMKSISVEDFDSFTVVENEIELNNYSLIKLENDFHEVNLSEKSFISYIQYVEAGQVFYEYPTLAAAFNFEYTDEGLKMIARFKNMKGGSTQEVLKEGYLIIGLNPMNDENITSLDEHLLPGQSKKTNDFYCKMLSDTKFIFVKQQNGGAIELQTSSGEKLNLTKGFSIGDALMYYSNGATKAKSDKVMEVVYTNGKFIGIKYTGKSNSSGNKPKAIIFTK